SERTRLKKILKEVLPEDAGVIVRTAAEGATEEQLTLDVARLQKQWEDLQAKVQKSQAPVLLHSEPDLLIKIVRDVFNEDFQKMVISGDDASETIEGYLASVAPDLLERVEKYTGSKDIFDEFRIGEQIAKALDRKVFLPSGGSLVIDRTEAMTVVDVNTGKFVIPGDADRPPGRVEGERAEELRSALAGVLRGGPAVLLKTAGVVLSPLTDRSVALIIKRRVQATGLDPRDFAGHSLRSGFATQAARDGHHQSQIGAVTRHKDERVLGGYIQAGSGIDNIATVL
ncbi:MAG: ribonuclease E/G, partial [Baekduiaceae bacterium]